MMVLGRVLRGQGGFCVILTQAPAVQLLLSATLCGFPGPFPKSLLPRLSFHADEHMVMHGPGAPGTPVRCQPSAPRSAALSPPQPASAG